ncbi:GlyGly-CTERM sorting domain-containing protein [Shewanella sp. SR43-4]|uniref:putative Ig domain-containing protein n=1 Tax=unclassified Shewanella TaxID=196818 RepID=UPI0015F9B39A|nr:MULTISPECIES: putative Ig domain-containing protein [unclassified Shewanella]MBB1316382.1 GlyGly-CTERM sorting domain-containing protein [Shewanella sp. SR43-4]MBB1323331.1 GlyGly-CTERM sorting domain-containing protein [Shewanella sp. SR43-8]
MFKTKSSAWLAMFGLLVSIKSYGVVFDEAQTNVIKDKMQHSISVSNIGLVEEGRIHNINKVYSAGRIAVGTESKYIHNFLANSDNTISYYGKQALVTDDNYYGINITLSPDGKFLYVISIIDSSYQLTVMKFDVDTKYWVEQFSYSALNGQTITNNDVIEISESGNYLFIRNQYERYVSITKRDAATGELVAVKLLGDSDNIPSQIDDIEFDDSNNILLLSGEGRDYNSTDPLVAYQLNPIDNTVAEISRVSRNSSYQSISNILYDQSTGNIFTSDNNEITVYRLDVAGETLTLKYNANSYIAFNTNSYISSASLSLVGSKLLVQRTSNTGKLYNFNDGVSPSFTLDKTVATNVLLSSLSRGDKLGWRLNNEKVELYASADNFYDYSKVSSIKDGQQNLPHLANGYSRNVFIESLGIIVVIDADGITSISADPAAKTSLFSANWTQFGIGQNVTPDIQSLSVHGDEIFIAGRNFSDNNYWENNKYIALKVAVDGTVSGGLKSLISSGNPLYYTDNAVFNKANNLAIFSNEDNNYIFVSIDADNNATLIDVLDTSLLGNSYYRQVGFVGGKPYVWDRSASKLYWIDLDLANKDVDVEEVIDLSGSVPTESSVLANEGNIYFVSRDAISSYKVNTDFSLSFMSVSFISGINNHNLVFVSQDYVVSTDYYALYTYAVDRESGSWKLLATTPASDYGISYFQNYNVFYADGLKQKAIFGAQAGDSAVGFMIADFSSSPVLKAAIMPVLANEGEKVELNIADFVFDADSDDVLTYSPTSLPADAMLSETGLLTLETKSSDSGDLNILVTDSRDMTLTILVPFYANTAPLIGTIDKYWVNPGENIVLDLAGSVTDPEGQSFTFAKDDGSELEVNPYGLVYGKLIAAGEHKVLATVTDSLGAKASLSAIVQVNSAPKSISLSPLSIKTAEAVILDVASSFTDADGHIMSFTAEGLPVGISISPEGNVTGSTTTSGKMTALVTATDSMGLSSNAILVINVTDGDSGGGSLGYIALLLLPLALRRKFY